MWIDAIKQRISESYPNQKPTIIVLVLQDSEVNLYNDIKRYCCKELKIFTQFFKASTLSSDKKCMSAAGKIILEIAAKVGKKLWTVPPQHPYWKDRFVATASLSYSKGLKNSFTMAMVGTTNNTQTSVYTYCMVGLSKREQVAMQIYANFFEKWLAEYLRCSKKLPDTIIVYR
jgi:chitinase